MAASLVAPYQLYPAFEELVLYYCCMSPEFWHRVGQHLDPDCMELPQSKPVLGAVRAIIRDTGSPPSSGLPVLQRLSVRVSQGSMKQADVQAVADLLDRVDDLPRRPDVDAAVRELAPVVRRQMQNRAILLAHDQYSRRGDFTNVQQLLDVSRRVGDPTVAMGTVLGDAAYQVIAEARLGERCGTGILELDLQLEGGPRLGELTTFVAASGGCKSMTLTHVAANCLRLRQMVGVVTLELPKYQQLARIMANLTGIATNDILDSQQFLEEAGRRLNHMLPHIGVCEVVDMPPGTTTVRDIIRWVEEMEQRHGCRMSSLVVDYADKLHHRGVRDNNQYVVMGEVYEALRRDVADLKSGRSMWVWTATQASRGGKDASKRLDMQHVADSLNKARVTDKMITVNGQLDDNGMLEWFVAKNRTGRSRMAVGPIASDLDRARVCVLGEFTDWSRV